MENMEQIIDNTTVVEEAVENTPVSAGKGLGNFFKGLLIVGGVTGAVVLTVKLVKKFVAKHKAQTGEAVKFAEDDYEDVE